MNQSIELQLESLTKLSMEQQNQKLRLFARVGVENKLKILQLQKQIFHQMKSLHTDVVNEILTLASLITAILKEFENSDEVELKSLIFRAKNARKKAKREKILELWAVIKTLKIDEQMSFRDIAKYLKKYHKFDVAHSTLFLMWNELEN